MTDSPEIAYEQPMDREQLSGSANWAIDERVVITVPTRAVTPLYWLQQVAGSALLLAATSVTSFIDPWAQTQQQRGQATMAAVFRPYRRRRISALEARRIALDILYRAEDERARIAEEEATRGIDWEEIP